MMLSCGTERVWALVVARAFLSSWEMSARSLFARQRVESLRWFPRIRLGRPIAKYFGYRPPQLDAEVVRQAELRATIVGVSSDTG